MSNEAPNNNAIMMSLEKEMPMVWTGQERFQAAEERALIMNSICKALGSRKALQKRYTIQHTEVDCFLQQHYRKAHPHKHVVLMELFCLVLYR